MLAQTATIDEAGRITLPKQMIEALGIHPQEEVMLEMTEAGVVIKPKLAAPPITARIAAMNLPVADWEQMEKEIESERLT